MASPRLTCIVTGKGRPTTYDYLQKKANRLGTTVTDLQKYYVSREAITRSRNATIEELVQDKKAFDALCKDKSWEDILALNTRGKTAKRNVSADNGQVVTTVVESKLSPETEAYEKTKEELIGKEAVAAIKEKVWDEPLAEEGIYVQVPAD